MTSADRPHRGLLLAAIAVLGLSIIPLLHAEEHHHHEEDEHEADHQHGHSHGPATSGPHGSGVLAHLGIALHAAPQLPEVAAVAEEHAPPPVIVAQLRGTLCYLVPEWSQGPPVAC